MLYSALIDAGRPGRSPDVLVPLIHVGLGKVFCKSEIALRAANIFIGTMSWAFGSKLSLWQANLWVLFSFSPLFLVLLERGQTLHCVDCFLRRGRCLAAGVLDAPR